MSVAEKALLGRKARKAFLAYLVKTNNGITREEAKGAFTKQHAVSHRTFAEYLADLEDEGVIYQAEDPATGRILWWHYGNNGGEKQK